MSRGRADDDAVLIVAICEAIDPEWNKGAAIMERMNLDRAERVRNAVADAIMRASLPTEILDRPNVKAWFVEGARWAASVVAPDR